MAVFDKVFNVTDAAVIEKINGTIMNAMCDTDEDAARRVPHLRSALKRDGIDIDGRIFDAGTFALIARTGCPDAGGEIPGAITRIESNEPALLHPIALRPAFRKAYADDAYLAYIVPSAPDIKVQGSPVTDDDIKRSLRVIKATGHIGHLCDVRASSFAFLTGEDGKVLCYPEDASDPDFRGKPIAFVRDLNAFLENDARAKKLAAMGDAESLLKGMGCDLATLPEAPEDCVRACEQQYAVTAKLAENLREHGIEPNIPIPGAPTQQVEANGVPAGQREFGGVRK